MARDRQSLADVRNSSSPWGVLVVAVLLGACVDAPITADQLEPDGRLRVAYGHEQAAFAAEPTEAVRSVVQVSAVLAAEAHGPLEDRNAFPHDVGTIHLHVRADGLLAPRPVTYRWTHGEFVMIEPGVLAPEGAMTRGASFSIDPAQTGTWEVQVLSEPFAEGEEPTVLFQREFEIEAAEPKLARREVP